MSDLMKIIGKNIYIWEIQEIYGGDVDRIASEVKKGGFQSAILHSTYTTNWRQSNRMALVKAMQALGIHVLGGCALYGTTAAAIEGKRAADLCKEFSLTGWVFDAEAKFDVSKSPDSGAANTLRAFRAAAPAGTLVGWCWWAFFQSPTGGSWHPKSILWAAMTAGYGDADFGLPMVYWNNGNDAATAVRFLVESWKQWRMVTKKPIIPIGRAYIGDAGIPLPEAMKTFEAKARDLGAEGVSWWSMEHAIDGDNCPGVWEALASMKPFGTDETTPVEERKPWEELSQAEKTERLKDLMVTHAWIVD